MCSGLDNKSKFEQIIRCKLKFWKNKSDVPVVAVILDSQNKIITSACNNSNKNNKIYGHAEINAIQQALNITKSNKLIGYKIISSLEPCMMCIGAINNSGIREIYYYLPSPKTGFIESNHTFNFLNWKTKLLKNELTLLIERQLTNFFQKLR